MLDKEMNYVIENYQKKSEFSSFLPGISGARGIPMWCYYTNRGQCVSCFGVTDKDHSIMEFYPAHQAYERTPLMGFRTFLKVDGKYMEAFVNPEAKHRMNIGMNSLSLEEETVQYKIRVEYETLPSEPLAGLMRQVTVTSKLEKETSIELVDGMSEIIPYGVTATTMKEMGQTAKAWMQVLDKDSKLPKFKVRASMEDSAEVTEITGMNFAMGKGSENNLLPVIVDKTVLFEYDHSLRKAYGLETNTLEELLSKTQIDCNDVPCCFFADKRIVKKNEMFSIKEIFGMSEDKGAYENLKEMFLTADWFEQKQRESKELAVHITERIKTETGDPVFDAYCRQNYLDNLLRGGYPVKIGKKQIFYLYSRKHGDMERDYNFYSMLPEYYSQGNGNFRDVNQNRRCDVQFSPFVGKSVIKTFYNALQINGYNPLVIDKIVYRLNEGDVKLLVESSEELAEIRRILQREFTPGSLYRSLEKSGLKNFNEIFEQIMDIAERIDSTLYGEGHWSDHWVYNLDLVESYLSVYPEKEKELFYDDASYMYTQAEKQILPRKKRYVRTEKGIRQYAFLKDNVDTSKEENRYLKDQKGKIVCTSLMTKMFTLLSNKISALDPYGMGIEMEGGKPGWYDALNGLPGLLGSSMAETYEVLRMALFMREIVEKTKKDISLPEELAVFQEKLLIACSQLNNTAGTGPEMVFWNHINDAKECFWEATALAISGNYTIYTYEQQKVYLDTCIAALQRGVEKADYVAGSVPPTYFYYEVKEFEEDKEGILPIKVQVKNTPDFLEGSVHALKLADNEKKENIYQAVRGSKLYDRILKMYKVNASLSEASFELGRACAFTPGWLENESVWLHMEYKYLLELLKAGLYEEFEEDFHNAAIPFLSENIYGRSLLENSSFIASSVNQNPRIHGKGFVARLSGSTAEFLQMWQIMMFGQRPFHIKDGELVLEFEPFIPKYLIGKNRKIKAEFLGQTEVTYNISGLERLVPGQYKMKEFQVYGSNGECYKTKELKGKVAENIRQGNIEKIEIFIIPVDEGERV